MASFKSVIQVNSISIIFAQSRTKTYRKQGRSKINSKHRSEEHTALKRDTTRGVSDKKYTQQVMRREKTGGSRAVGSQV